MRVTRILSDPFCGELETFALLPSPCPPHLSNSVTPNSHRTSLGKSCEFGFPSYFKAQPQYHLLQGGFQDAPEPEAAANHLGTASLRWRHACRAVTAHTSSQPAGWMGNAAWEGPGAFSLPQPQQPPPPHPHHVPGPTARRSSCSHNVGRSTNGLPSQEPSPLLRRSVPAVLAKPSAGASVG